MDQLYISPQFNIPSTHTGIEKSYSGLGRILVLDSMPRHPVFDLHLRLLGSRKEHDSHTHGPLIQGDVAITVAHVVAGAGLVWAVAVVEAGDDAAAAGAG